MSNFNQANEMASELVFGETYDREALDAPRPERLVFINGDSMALVTAREESQQGWFEVASAIHNLLNHGYRIGCEMNVSWNCRYDKDGDRLPDSNFMPCGKPVSVFLDGCHLCDRHKAEYIASTNDSAN